MHGTRTDRAGSRPCHRRRPTAAARHGIPSGVVETPVSGTLQDLLANSGDDRFRLLSDRLREPVFCKDAEGRFIYANPATWRAIGAVDGATVLGRKLVEICPGEEAQGIERNDRKVLRNGRTMVIEETLTQGDRTRVYLSTKAAISDQGGAVQGLACVWVDITALGANPSRMRTRALRLRRGLEAAGEQVYAWNPDTGRFGASTRLHELVGETRPILDIGSWTERIHPDDRAIHEKWCCDLRRIVDGTVDLEYRVRHSEGRWLWIWERAIVLGTSRRGSRKVTSNIANITERKGVEERLQTALDAARIGLWSAGADGRDLLFSPRALTLFDFESPDVVPSFPAILSRILPSDRHRVLRTCLQISRRYRDPLHPLQFRIRLRDGHVRWIESAMRLVLTPDHGPGNDTEPQMAAVVGTASDISARKNAESDQVASAERFRRLIENLGDVYWIVDHHQRKTIYVSPACESLWGYSQSALYSCAPHWPECIHRGDRERVEAAYAAIESTGDFEAEYRIVRKDGGLCWVRDRAVMVHSADGDAERIIGVAEDVTERRKVDSGVLERERRLNLALAASRLHVWTFDIGAQRLSVAEALCASLGLQARHCARLGGWRRRICKADRARVERAFCDCLGGGPDLDVEFRVQLRSGVMRWLALKATLIAKDEVGSQLYGVCADVTERRADEERLRANELQLRTINDTIPTGIARCSRERRYLFVNRAYAQDVLALPADEAVGRFVSDLIGPEAASTLEPHIERVLAGERVELATTLDFRGVGLRTVTLSLVPECDEAGKVSGWIEVVNDVTERTRVEGKLYQRDREFETLVENAPDIIARLDRNLRYLYINQAIRQALGRDPHGFVGRNGTELDLPSSMRVPLEGAIATAFSSGVEQPAQFELSAMADGQRDTHYFNARLIPEFDRSGGIVESVLMVVYDVTERTRAQRERERLHAAERAAREHAEAAARARDQFLAIVSHELRSPLNGIQNWSNVLDTQLSDNAPPIARRALNGIRSGISQQVRLIEDLLDATRIMSGNLSLAPAVIEIRPVVEAAITSVNATAAAKQIELQAELALEGEKVRADPDRVQQIIWNLLSNALKFTPSGGHVRVSLDRVAEWVRLRVEDDGKGIDPDFLPRMFDWFRRDETSSHRGQEGLGLGLALVRHLCELHGGQVFADSPGPGRGSVFEVRLPLLPEPFERRAGKIGGAAEPQRPLPSLDGLRVALVDDQKDTLDALSVLLSNMGAQVWTFGSGQGVLNWLIRQDGRSVADVVVCDLAMPGEDGYSTLARLRGTEHALGVRESDRLPAIALTAFAHQHERERALGSGFAMHISKPVSGHELADAILRVIRERTA